MRVWNVATSYNSKLSNFRLSDNYIRFYLKYIEKNISLSNFSNWATIIGLQFENLVLNNRNLIHKALEMPPEDIVCANPFFQTTTSKTKGCQIDYMVQTKFANLYVCEIKFSTNQIGVKIINEMQEKLSKLHTLKKFSYRPVLIHANGVQQCLEDGDYFAKIIDFTEFLD